MTDLEQFGNGGRDYRHGLGKTKEKSDDGGCGSREREEQSEPNPLIAHD